MHVQHQPGMSAPFSYRTDQYKICDVRTCALFFIHVKSFREQMRYVHFILNCYINETLPKLQLLVDTLCAIYPTKCHVFNVMCSHEWTCASIFIYMDALKTNMVVYVHHKRHNWFLLM